MEAVNLNNHITSRPELVGRKNRIKIKRKERLKNKYLFLKKILSGVGSVYIILALVVYILISEVKLNNAITNIQKDQYIPRYVIEKVIDYLK